MLLLADATRAPALHPIETDWLRHRPPRAEAAEIVERIPDRATLQAILGNLAERHELLGALLHRIGETHRVQVLM